MKRNYRACKIILRITRDLIYYFNHYSTLRNDVQIFNEYLIFMNDTNVTVFEKSIKENIKALKD